MKEKCIFDKNVKLVFTGWIYLVRYKNIKKMIKENESKYLNDLVCLD